MSTLYFIKTNSYAGVYLTICWWCALDEFLELVYAVFGVKLKELLRLRI